MRSIDDIIDKLDTCSADGGPKVGDSESASQHLADAADQHSLRADTVKVQSQTARQPTVGSGSFSLPTGQPRSASESTDSEPLWNMFGLPLTQLCRRLLTDAHEQRSVDVAKTRSVESPPTAKTENVLTTHVSKNVEVLQTPRVSVDVQSRMDSTQVGVVESNGHKPPLPTKPSLPPKPPIAKKPWLSKETSAGLLRKPSSLLSPPYPSTSSSTQSRQIRSTSSLQSDDTSISAPTSPTVGVTQRDAGQQHQERHQYQQQQQQESAVRRTASDVAPTTTRSRGTGHTSPTKVSEKPTTTGDADDRISSSPVRDRMKTTKSEEFLARIHRRSVSPVGTPRLIARGGRGKSVDLSAASDTSASISRRTLSKEWAVVTTTTHEEVTVVYRPPTTSSASEVVPVDAPTATSSVKSHGTVNNNVVDSSGGRLYKTAIDNIRLSVNTGDSSITKRTSSDAGNEGDVSCERPGVGSSSSDGDGGGRQSANSAHQLDHLISSLIEMAVEDAQPLQPPSMRHGVISTAANY